MWINKETVLCISVASKPGNIGATIHNAAYAELGLNFIYLPRITTSMSETISAIRAIGIRGCSVSMPFKEEAAALVDELSPPALKIGAINTIVNNDGKLYGENTDYFAISKALKEIDKKIETALVLGYGGMAKACLLALEDTLDITPSVAVRPKLSRTIEEHYRVINWDERNEGQYDLIINATPIGMASMAREIPFDVDSCNPNSVVFDAVSSPTVTRLNKEARQRGISFLPGTELALLQSYKQFQLYTGHFPPEKKMREVLYSHLDQNS